MDNLIIQTRVIAGTKRATKLINPGKGTRPLMDRIKTSIFDLIRDFLQEATVLDLYAGGGNFGIEALSRGAKHAAFVDISAAAFKIIYQNLLRTGFNEQAKVIHSNVQDYVRLAEQRGESFDIIFADPPFKEVVIEHLLDATKLLNKNGIFIVRTPAQFNLSENIGKLKLSYSKKYGKSLVSFYQKA